MTTKVNGATPAELFAEAIKGTVEEAVTPVLEEMAEMEVRFNGRLDGLQSQINDASEGLQSQINGLQGQIHGLQGQVTGLQGQVNGVARDVESLKRGGLPKQHQPPA